jgi:hypothetical protein
MKMLLLFSMIGLLSACVPVSDSDRPIRTPADVERYNATVTREGAKLVCDRERVTGSNLPQFVCMTVDQRERLANEAADTIRSIRPGAPAN